MWLNVVTVEGTTSRDFLRVSHCVNLLTERIILSAWFDQPEESCSYNKVQFKRFCLPVKTSYSSAETSIRPLDVFFLLEMSTQKKKQSGHAGFVSGKVRLLVA